MKLHILGLRILQVREYGILKCIFGPRRLSSGAAPSTDIDRHLTLSQPWATACIVYRAALLSTSAPDLRPFVYHRRPP